MKPLRRSAAVLVIGGVSVAAAFFGFNFVRDANFARAQQQVDTTREQLAHVEDLATVFREVGKVVEPSVVHINVRKSGKAVRRALPFDDGTLRKFFPDRDGDGEPDLPPGMNPDGGDGGFEQMGTGSGVIMEKEDGVGYVVTNNHVAGEAETLEITLADGRKITNGKLLGADPKTDLAVIKIEADRLIAAKWGDSEELQKGDWILAFGSPFGYIGSMTHGIVSALDRNAGILGQFGYENFIQVDAPINPGNSGGPLVNVRGEVVGINTAIASRTGGFQGIGFAIPSNQAKYVYQQLKEKGRVTRGWLGVSISDVAKDLPKAQSFGYQDTKGVLVEQVFPGTPSSGKLKAGDIIVEMDGKAVDDVQELRSKIASTAPDQEVHMKVFRDGKTDSVAIKIGDQPDDVMAAARGQKPEESQAPSEVSAEALGLKLTTITEELAEQYKLTDQKTGALVTAVEPRSPAAQEGIQPGDVITRVGTEKVDSAKEASDALSKQDLEKGVRLYVASKEGSRFVFVKKK